MPLIHRISVVSMGLFSRWSKYVQSEKLPYLIPGITKRQHPSQFADLIISWVMDRYGLNRYPNYKVI